MAKFRFKYSLTVWILLVALSLVCLLGGVLNLINVINGFNNLSINWVKKASGIILCVICFAVFFAVIFMMAKSEYTIDEKHIKLRLGIIFTRIEIKHVAGFIHATKKQTLAIITDSERASFILINEQLYGDFIATVKKHNPQVSVCFEQ